jgi:hypothetical protein
VTIHYPESTLRWGKFKVPVEIRRFAQISDSFDQVHIRAFVAGGLPKAESHAAAA